MSDRFINRYEARHARRARGEVPRWIRPFRVALGVLMLVVSVLIGWLPGPGFVPLAIGGGYLVGGEVRWAALRFDRAESWGRAWVSRRLERTSGHCARRGD